MPEWKLPNPSQFINDTLHAVEVLRQSLITGQKSISFIQIDADAPCLLYNMEEALTAILNVAIHNDAENTLLKESYLTQLGNILDDFKLQELESPNIARIKARILELLVYLTRTPHDAGKIIENVAVMKNVLNILKNNNKESVNLYSKVLQVFENISSNESFQTILLNYGYYVALLESILKLEIYPVKYRLKAYELLLKTLRSQGSANIFNSFITQMFPSYIQEIINHENTPEETLKILDNGYDAPKVLWTKLMRQEILLLTAKQTDLIQQKWENCDRLELNLEEQTPFWESTVEVEKPAFPEIEESIRVDGVYLKNFNRIPLLDKEMNIGVFIDSIANTINGFYITFVSQAVKFNKEQARLSDDDGQSFKRISNEFLVLLTSLLLGIDQFMGEIKSKEESEVQVVEVNDLDKGLEEPIVEEPSEAERSQDEIFFLSESAVTCIVKCMELFNKPMIHPHILSTELQLLFLIIESQRGFSVVKNSDIISLLSDLLRRIGNSDSQFTYVEEKMVLSLLLKVSLRDPSLVPDAVDACLGPLRKIIRGPKTYLRPFVEQCITIFSRNPEKGKEAFLEINKEGQVITVEIIHDCMPHSFLENIWRSCSKGWNPFKADNLLNLLYKASPDNKIEYPAISDYAIISSLHPSKENAIVEKRINEYIQDIVEEHSSSQDPEIPKEIKWTNDII